MDAKTIIDQTEKYYLPVFGRYQLALTHGKGCKLYDADGNEYLDFLAGIAVNSLGHAHPALVKAISEQAAKLMHCSNIYYTDIQAKAVKEIIETTGFDRVFLANSGAEANEAAIKIARKATGKQEIITFVNSFHGRTFGSMSATGQDKIKDGFGDVVPHFSYAIYNDLDSVKSLVTDDTAAIMLELVQGESGVRPADKGFVTALSAFCQETGILLIVDEVQTGMGRTGKLFSFEHYGIEPDIFTLAKGLGNGVPVGAMLAKEKLGLAFSYGSHGSTFGGNKLVMSAASSVLDIMLADGFLPQAFDNGNYLQAELKKALAGNAKVTDVRGLGYMIGVETTENLAELVEKARDKGLIVLTAGTNVVRLLPPLTLTKEEVDQGVAILAEVFA